MQQIIGTTYNHNYNQPQPVVFYNMVGNFVPPEWKDLQGSSGKSLSKTSRQLLSLIVFHFEANINIEADQLQKSYYFFEQQLGVGQKRVRQCFDELIQAEFVNFELLTIIKNNIKCRNILSIRLLKNFKNIRTDDITPANQKKFSNQQEKNFHLGGKNFPVHNIIDNNKSIESRSTKSNVIDFSKNYLGKKSTCESDQQIPTSVGTANPMVQENISNRPLKASSKIRDVSGFRKKLVEFHPLDETDCSLLQMRSGREFSLNFINLLLLKLGRQYPDHSFPNKKAFLTYMAKALAYEMRDAVRVNNESFRFKQDEELKEREEYLAKVEFSKDTSQTEQLRRKLAGVLAPELAYELLSSCSFGDPNDNCYRLKPRRNIAISKHLENILLREVQAVYGNHIEQIEIIPYSQVSHPTTNKKKATEYQPLQGLDKASAWFKVREQLIKACGVSTDRNWFSKIEMVEEDKVARKLILKPQTTFIGDWIMQNYDMILQRACAAQDFTFEMIQCY